MVQAGAVLCSRYGAGAVRLLLSAFLVLLLVPGWSGTERLPLIGADPAVHARRWAPDGGWPRRIGLLAPAGAVSLSASDPAFGGFSALAVSGGIATLLSDGGNMVALDLRGGAIAARWARPLPAGPGTGWAKESRDTESLAHDPASGRWWVGYERANQIWRYAPDLSRSEALGTIPARRGWKRNSGAETLVRLRDGRFLAISEGRSKGETRGALLWSGDPSANEARPRALAYLPPAGLSPTDAAELPNGDLVVLNRRFLKPFRFACVVTRVPRAAIRAEAVMRGRVIADLGPALGENCEGVAVTRSRESTWLWIVTDNDLAFYRPTILARFRLLAD